MTEEPLEPRIAPPEPGPPGLVSSDPIASPPVARCRMSESSISPAPGFAQSSGALTFVQSKPLSQACHDSS